MIQRAARRRKTSPKLALRIARAQLRAIRGFVPVSPAKPHPKGPARFIQLCAVTRGYASILHGLDEDGQVWERVSLLENKVLKDAWWAKVSMDRR